MPRRVGRPRTTTDEAILTGAARALTRVGPARLTLADVAAEVGLAPATLLQRFGSKRGLLLAFVEEAALAARQEFAAARTPARSPLQTLEAALCDMTRHVATPEALSNNLAFLQMDLSDPEFHRHTLDHARTVRMEIQTLLDEAVQAGELAPCDTNRLARAVQATYNGALMTWAIFREGSVADWLQDEFHTLVDVFRFQSQ
jgi:AcrR family transcriptional regulator